MGYLILSCIWHFLLDMFVWFGKNPYKDKARFAGSDKKGQFDKMSKMDVNNFAPRTLN